MSNDNELFKLCKEVYEKTGWGTPDWWSVDKSTIFTTGGKTDAVDCPAYDSDYLLEKLPREIDGNDLVLTPVMDTGWGACYERNGLKTQAIDDTPLKALLKLVIALDDAGVKL